MKSILLCVAILLSVSCNRDPELYLSQDHQTAFKLAHKTGKMILIDFYTQWCGTCKAYDKYIFPDSVFQDYIKSKFYFLKLDAELPENIELARKFGISAYPTLVLLDPHGNETNRITGYFGSDPEYYVKYIESILHGKENYESYVKQYISSPDSLELVKEIAEKLFSNDEYKHVIEFCALANKHTNMPEILVETKLYEGVAEARDPSIRSTATLRAILEDPDTTSGPFEEFILCELNSFYKDHPDSFEHFGFRVMEKYPNSFYANRNFAEYLFLNRRDIKKAEKYAQYYNTLVPDDHWSAYLIALSYAVNNDAEKGARHYDNWITEHESKFDTDWPLFFYVQYAILFKIRIDQAIEYAYKIENGACDKTEVKINLARLLHEKGENLKAIEKLHEVIPIISGAEEKRQVDDLIKEYSI